MSTQKKQARPGVGARAKQAAGYGSASIVLATTSPRNERSA